MKCCIFLCVLACLLQFTLSDKGLLDTPTHKVWMDIKIPHYRKRRCTFGLFGNKWPKTVELFRALITGEKGNSTLGRPLSFKNHIFHQNEDNYGAFIGNFTGEELIKISGTPDMNYTDEIGQYAHNRRYLLTRHTHSNNSDFEQFTITYNWLKMLDKTHTVFGEVLDGYDIIDMLEDEGADFYPEGHFFQPCVARIDIVDWGMVE